MPILNFLFLQIVPLRPPPNEILTERSVFINGSQEQIDSAQEMVNEIVREVSDIFAFDTLGKCESTTFSAYACFMNLISLFKFNF